MQKSVDNYTQDRWGNSKHNEFININLEEDISGLEEGRRI